LSGRGLCVRLMTHPEESYRVWSWSIDTEEALAHEGLLRHGKTIKYTEVSFRLFCVGVKLRLWHWRRHTGVGCSRTWCSGDYLVVRGEVIGGWRKLHDEELLVLLAKY
jgi:hypothetical protein